MLQITGSSSSKIPAQPDVNTQITERVRGEFREMPGLTLSLAQACRLWNLDSRTCHDVLNRLVEAGYLRTRADGAFCRASDLAAAHPLRMAKASLEFIEIEQPKREAAEG